MNKLFAPLFLGTSILGAVLLSLGLLCPSYAYAQTITRGPYLQRGYKTFTIVKWRTSASTDSVVKVGMSPGQESLTFSDAIGTEHRVELSGLQPATKYFYKIVADGNTLAGGDTSHYFVTTPNDGDEPFNVWAIGDSGISGGTIDANQAAVRDAFLSVVPLEDLAFFVHLGDIAYTQGLDSQYQTSFFNAYPTVLRALTTWPTQGNHDFTANAYYSVFSLPRYGEAGGVTSNTEYYYSWDHGNAHFVSLNSEIDDSTTRTSMITWLNQDLAASSKTWTVVIFHHPPYTKGSHNSDSPTDSGGRMQWMRENILPTLENRGVDLVLSGHSHGYERSFLIDGHYGTSSSFNSSHKRSLGSGKDDRGEAFSKATLSPVSNGGTVYVVAGSGGQLSTGLPMNHPAMHTSQEVLGSLHLAFNANELDVRFITSDQSIGDYFTIRKGSERPRRPLAFDVGPATASCGLSMTWTSATAATSYSIYRSDTRLSRGSLLAQGVPSTSYTDPAPTPGVTHYYSVRGENADGQGPWSALDSGVVSTSDRDGDGTTDCSDGCPDDASSTSPGACGCGKRPLGEFADGTENCSRELSKGITPTAPKVITSKRRLRVVMDSYPKKDVRSYSVAFSHGGRVVKRVSSKDSLVSTRLSYRGTIVIRYNITFRNGTQRQSTKWSKPSSAKLP